MSAAYTIVAEHDLLIRLSINVNHVALAAFDEADDLHLTAATRALQRIDFIDMLDYCSGR